MKTLTLTVLGTLMALGTGCASTGAQAADARLVASASAARMVVEVDGQGSVELGSAGERCASRCQLDWDKVAEPVLLAAAAPGWSFDHWETPADLRLGSNDPASPRVYRAVFTRSDNRVAKR